MVDEAIENIYLDLGENPIRTRQGRLVRGGRGDNAHPYNLKQNISAC